MADPVVIETVVLTRFEYDGLLAQLRESKRSEAQAADFLTGALDDRDHFMECWREAVELARDIIGNDHRNQYFEELVEMEKAVRFHFDRPKEYNPLDDEPDYLDD